MQGSYKKYDERCNNNKGNQYSLPNDEHMETI